MIRLLFIDDDESAQDTLKVVLQDEFLVASSLTGREGIEAVRADEPDVVLLDINLPDLDGLEVLEALSRVIPCPPVIMLTAYSDVQLVKRAIQLGACDYILKPFQLDQLTGTIRRAVQNIPARRSFTPGTEGEILSGLVGESPAIREVKAFLLRYGPSDAPVLIQGESGTGKELAASAIHRLSPRRNAPLIAVNCTAIPETLLEAELFGVERGAYTDAVSRPGLFEQANGGTIFLDEIGEMSCPAQAKLLRVLEAKEVVRVGGRQRIPLNIRIASATNKNLKEEIDAGRFREDLYYRVSVLPMNLPPLRERAADIPLLVAHFLSGPAGHNPAAGERSCGAVTVDPPAMDRLIRHSWPGNVRELRNVVERAVLLSEGRIIRLRDIRLQ
jgi:DNA-binding NtrC family response regulator